MIVIYIYEGHLGSLYVSDYGLDYDDLYCEQCGDSDWLIGHAETRKEAWELLKDSTDTFDESLCNDCHYTNICDECENYQHSGGWDYEYVMNFINSNWDE